MSKTASLWYPIVPALLLVVTVLAVTAGCGGDLVLPEPSSGDLHLAVLSGNDQTGTVGEPLPQPLVVEVRDDQGHPTPGARVAFVAVDGPTEADLSPDTATTNSSGQASGRWVLGTSPGTYGAEARLVTEASTAAAPPSARFSASAEPGQPDTLRAVSPTSQSGRRSRELDDPVVVQVVDHFGNPVAGVTVQWQVTAGEGNVNDSEVETGADGRSSVRWTLGGRIGVQKLEASVAGGVSGSPVVFSVTVLF